MKKKVRSVSLRISPYSALMRENTDQKKTPYLDTFHTVNHTQCTFFEYLRANEILYKKQFGLEKGTQLDMQ